MIEGIISSLADITEDPYKRARDWKEATGGKVIGCFPMHIPEEIISAAGMLPVTLLGNEKKISFADEYLQPSVCHLARGNLGLALRGDLNFLDGIIFPDICDVVKNLPDIWWLHHPLPLHQQYSPRGEPQHPGHGLDETVFPSWNQHGPGDGGDDQLREPLAGFHAAGNRVSVCNAV